ncbi:hypothetical protein F9L07_22735 [Pimelobacter simplex]|uniref:Uncharacterized protein n=1 Tax=Nocardioides simplex TaxID=2045 RepID=A0A7J5DTH8_NOCSI|nr:hypothetical protein [Pimelobacter simplex]KAB2808335.1 hypothetical protein F9L07_22735 [Pimelobacter simplex]
MSAEKCRFMQAAYPDLDARDSCSEHRHDNQTFALARALAVVCQDPDPSDEQIGWLIDDAAAVVDDFDPAPADWVVTPPEMGEAANRYGVDFTLTINGIDYVVPESEWEPSHPVALAKWRKWNDDAGEADR